MTMSQISSTVRWACRIAAVVSTGLLFAACSTGAGTQEAILASGDVGRSTVALTGDGQTAYYTWVERTDGAWNVWVSAWEQGAEGPSAPVRVNATPGNAAAHDQAPPQVGVDLEGRVYVAWTNSIPVEGRRFPASDLFVAVSSDGGRTFGEEQHVHSDAGGVPAGHTFHNLTRLADGAMLVSWIDGRRSEAARREAAAAGGDAGADGASGDAGAANSGHATGQHTAHAAMHASDIGSEIRVARIEDGGVRILETAILDTSSCPCCRTNLAVDAHGRIYATWRHEYENGDRDIVLAFSDDGGLTFSEPRPVRRDYWNISACPHTGPAIDVAPTGDVHIAWYTGADDNTGVQHVISRDRGETFTLARNVLPNVPVAQVALSPDSEGNVRLLTEDATRGGLSRWRVRGGSVTWQDVREGASLPSIKYSGDTVAATWKEGSRLVAQIQRAQ